jgi:histidine ammonia-lyase
VAALRERVPGPGGDRFVAPVLAEAEELVSSGALMRSVESVVGELG